MKNTKPEKFDKIKEKIIDLKISDKLSYGNPLKKYTYNLENKDSNNFIYKCIAIFSFVYCMYTQFSALMEHFFVSLFMLPFTLYMIYLLYSSQQYIYNINNSLSDCLSGVILKTNQDEYSQAMVSKRDKMFLIFMLLSVICVFLYTMIFKNNLNSEELIFYIVVTSFLSQAVIIFKNIYASFERIKIILSLGVKYSNIGLLILLILFVFSYQIFHFFYANIFIENSSILTILSIFLIYLLGYIQLNVAAILYYFFVKKTALLIDRLYK